MSTVYDVAKLVGVSHSAASAVLNGKPIHVSEATRQRILDGAKTLGYRPNRAAQQLSTGRFDTIAVCFERSSPDFFLNPVANQLIAGIGHSALENDLSLLLKPLKVNEIFSQTIGGLSLHGVDGGIVIGPIPLSNKPVSAIDSCTLPLVCIESHPRLESASTVDTDNFSGMKIGVEHLIANGHKKMAYIGPAPRFQCMLDRIGGFYEAVGDADLSLSEQSTCVASLEEIPAVMHQLVEKTDRPTALICAGRDTGLAALDEVMRLGLSLPKDLAVLVYDDISEHPLSKSTSFIRNNFQKVGAAAGDLLKKLINGECSGPVSIRLPADFVPYTG